MKYAYPMIVRILMLLLINICFFGCKSDRLDVDLSGIDKKSSFKRFDQAFFTCDTTDFTTALAELKKEYPEFFLSNDDSEFWWNLRTNDLQNRLFNTSSRVFNDFGTYQEDLDLAMKHFYYYFPDADEIKFYSYISDLDFNYPVLMADELCFVALDQFLGSGFRDYQILPAYMQFFRQPKFMVRDCMEEMAMQSIVRKPGTPSMLDDMIYHGKVLYFIESMMPDVNEEIIVKFNSTDLSFCKENERSIWAYFLERELLFDTSSDAKRRFIEIAPFSKFGTDFDRESPGMIGRWIGWEIIRSYMNKNESTSLIELLRENDSKKILKLSGYKP